MSVMRFLRPIDLPKIDRLDVRPYWAQLLPLKYVVFSGRVRSRNDGQVHHVSAQELISLYRVHPQECVVVRNARDALGRRDVIEALLPLRPDYSGRYEAPTRKEWRG